MTPRPEAPKPTWQSAADALFKVAFFMLTVVGTLVLVIFNDVKDQLKEVSNDVKILLEHKTETKQKFTDLERRVDRSEINIDRLKEKI